MATKTLQGFNLSELKKLVKPNAKHNAYHFKHGRKFWICASDSEGNPITFFTNSMIMIRFPMSIQRTCEVFGLPEVDEADIDYSNFVDAYINQFDKVVKQNRVRCEISNWSYNGMRPVFQPKEEPEKFYPSLYNEDYLFVTKGGGGCCSKAANSNAPLMYYNCWEMSEYDQVAMIVMPIHSATHENIYLDTCAIQEAIYERERSWEKTRSKFLNTEADLK